MINSRHPLVCAPTPELPPKRAPFSRTYGSNLPSSFNAVLSSALVYSTCPPVSVWGTVLKGGYFQGLPGSQTNPIRIDCFRNPSLIPWHRNIHLFPIVYAFLPRLRGRLTLRRLALRRNPWTFGESVSHTLYRYSCQHSRFRYVQATSRLPFIRLRNAPLPLNKLSPKLRCVVLAPLHFRRGDPYLDQ